MDARSSPSAANGWLCASATPPSRPASRAASPGLVSRCEPGAGRWDTCTASPPRCRTAPRGRGGGRSAFSRTRCAWPTTRCAHRRRRCWEASKHGRMPKRPSCSSMPICTWGTSCARRMAPSTSSISTTAATTGRSTTSRCAPIICPAETATHGRKERRAPSRLRVFLDGYAVAHEPPRDADLLDLLMRLRDLEMYAWIQVRDGGPPSDRTLASMARRKPAILARTTPVDASVLHG